ncbi:hypothetical protein L6R53_24955 [Myxococcota bacterium]|nr:hypothetical protein [Myxococcota bacterium]
MSIILLAAALAGPPAGAADAVVELVDAGRPMPAGTPIALIVATPGLATPAYGPLVAALEDEGLDAWLARFPLGAQDPDAIVTTGIPAARRALPEAPLALVGHGPGGTLAARAALADPPRALALLGAPLAPPRSALVSWLVDQPIPVDGLDLGRVEGTWRGQPVAPLLLGAAPPPMERASAAWLRGLQAWVREGAAVDLRPAGFPVWAGTGLLDEVAPAEGVRPWLGPGTHLRFGYLRMDPDAYDNAGLLAGERPTRALARWLADALR